MNNNSDSPIHDQVRADLDRATTAALDELATARHAVPAPVRVPWDWRSSWPLLAGALVVALLTVVIVLVALSR